jgi:hypothetical protein
MVIIKKFILLILLLATIYGNVGISGEYFYTEGHGAIIKKKILAELNDSISERFTVGMPELRSIKIPGTALSVERLENGNLNYVKIIPDEMEFNIFLTTSSPERKILIGTSERNSNTYCEYLATGIEGRSACIKQMKALVDYILSNQN